MPTEPIRELILQNLATTLAAIDGFDPYWTNVRSVRRLPAVPTDFEGHERPGLLIVATGEPETIEHKHNYHDRRDLRCGVIGILDRPESDDGKAINRFMRDVGIAVMADVTRGGHATQTFVTQRIDASNLFGDLALFELELSIIYHCDGRQE